MRFLPDKAMRRLPHFLDSIGRPRGAAAGALRCVPLRHYTLLALMAIAVPLALLLPLRRPLFPDDYSTVVCDRRDRPLRIFLNRQQQWCLPPEPGAAVPEKLRRAVLCYEDRFFYLHPGINPVALIRAAWLNARCGRIVSGASTLTMQVARMARPGPRTLAHKTAEMWLALRIELSRSKDQILRLYLDHAPYGGNIVGVRAACLRYYGKRPEQLTWGEAATLAVIPRAPGRVSPLAGRDRLRARRDRLLERLCKRGVIPEDIRNSARLEPLPKRPVALPMLAPHLARSLRGGKGAVVRTTLDADLQRRIEQLLAHHVRELGDLGIENGAVLVAETNNGAVRAYAGSHDFFDSDAAGQVDGVRAPRSSGSLLKPFLYALCMDDGLLLPSTRIKDVPTRYPAFDAVNADRGYRGLVTVREALIRSLNVPAVRTLDRYGVFRFATFCREAGMSTLFRPADDYGLTLVLGGAETTLWDMARLYRGLGRGGRFDPLHLLRDSDAAGESPRLISPGACYLVLDVLRDVERPGIEFFWTRYSDARPMAWKTGTSFGQRDAWAVGVTPQWTIAVWIGNFDGRGNANLAGARCAGPLLFDLFAALPRDPERQWFRCPEAGLREIELCRETGYRAGPFCGQTETALAPARMAPLAVCPYHREIVVDREGRMEVCSLCWEPGNHNTAHRLIYPPDVVQLLRAQGRSVESAPPHNPLCPALPPFRSVEILYPPAGASLWTPRDYDGLWQKVMLRAAHCHSGRAIYWYLDRRYLGCTRGRHVRAVELECGEHVLEIVDEQGLRDRRCFTVSRSPSG